LLAYASDESKQFEIYVQTFPKPGDKKQVSVNGGTRPVWSRDGTELFFIGADGEMTAVEVKGAAPSDNTSRFEAGTLKPLFDSGLGPTAEYDVSKDGRLLLPRSIEHPASEQVLFTCTSADDGTTWL
jgi:hypothetical protein